MLVLGVKLMVLHCVPPSFDCATCYGIINIIFDVVNSFLSADSIATVYAVCCAWIDVLF